MNSETTNIFIYFIINVFDLWVIVRYFDRVLRLAKKKKIINYIIYFLFLIFFTLLIRYELEYSNIVSIAAWSLLFLVFYEGNGQSKLLYAVILIVFAGFSQMLMYFIIHSDTHTVYSYFIPHFIFFLVLELVARYQTIKEKRIDRKVLLLLVSVPILSFIAMPCIVMLMEQTNVPISESTGIFAPIAVLMLYVNIMVFYMYDRISSVYEIEKQKEEYEMQLIWQKEYYDELQDNYNSVRKIKHDMQNNLQAMNKLMRENKTKELAVYLNELITAEEEIENIISTGNYGIDTILNIKLTRAQKHGIEMEREISIPSQLPLPYRHCISILGNLLDNAINVLKDEVEVPKVMKVFLSFQGNALVIQVSNQYRDKPIKEYKDDCFHGLGLRIVKETVEIYNGTYEVEDDGKNFAVNIILYLDI